MAYLQYIFNSTCLFVLNIQWKVVVDFNPQIFFNWTCPLNSSLLLAKTKKTLSLPPSIKHTLLYLFLLKIIYWWINDSSTRSWTKVGMATGRVFSYLDPTLGLGPGSSIKQKFFSQGSGPPHQASRAPFRPTKFGPKSWPNLRPKSWPNLKKKKKNIFIFRSH